MANLNQRTSAVDLSNETVICLLQDLSQVLCGLGVDRQSKLDELIRNLAAANNSLKDGERVQITGKYARELVEAHQLLPIAPWATTALRSAAPNTWQRILRDSTDLISAKEQTDPRNWQYELNLCSRMLHANLEASWPNVEKEPDIRLKVENQSIAVEAKRPAGENSVEKNVSKAIGQLFSGCLDREPGTVGLIALSLDLCLLHRLIRPIEIEPNAPTVEVYHYPVGDQPDDLAEPFSKLCSEMILLPKVKKLRDNPRIAGIMFTCCYPGVLRRPGAAPKLCVVNRTAFPFASTPENKALLWSLVSSLGSAEKPF